MCRPVIFCYSCFCLLFLFSGSIIADELYNREPINYLEATPNDPVAQLQAKIDSGEVELEYDEEYGYLKAVLEHLKVPVSSQGLVFSKTSFQLQRISPKTPRAVYFNDESYVGWVQNGKVVEISSVDPELGGVFYSLPQRQKEKPQFKRHTHACLQCHSSSMTKDVPGHLVRSVFPMKSGRADYSRGTFKVDDQTPLKNRWGGWYVTGTHGDQRHMGNVHLPVGERSAVDDDAELDTEAGANVTDLSPLFNVDKYLSPHSDLVALMVLEHQTQMHNILTQGNYYGKLALNDEAIIRKMIAEDEEKQSEAPSEYERSPSIQLRIDNAAKRIVKMLLFVKAAPLDSPLTGTSGFTTSFPKTGPFDNQGRTLREFDLQTRLFKYPCSYLIYSDAFDALPKAVKDSAYQQLWDILTAEKTEEEYAHLSLEDRQAIREILLETKPGLPEYWK